MQVDIHTHTYRRYTLMCALQSSRHPNRRSSTTSSLCSAQECLWVVVGSGFTQGGAAFGWKEAQLLHRELWKQLPHHPNAPETIRQLLSKKHTHKLFCQPIVLSHHITAGRAVLTSRCCSRPHKENATEKTTVGQLRSWLGRQWRKGGARSGV